MKKKTGVQTGTVKMVVSPLNGATMPAGAHPGNTGGKPGRSGRIKEKVKRQLLRASLMHGAKVLADVASGELVERRQVVLADVLPFVMCPHCGKDGMSPYLDDEDAALITFDAKVSASVKDRRGAVDTMLRYSVGLRDDLTVLHPEVQKRLEQTVALIASRSDWISAELLEGLSRVWKE